MTYAIQSSTSDRTDTHEQSVNIGYTVGGRRATPENHAAYQRRDSKIGVVQHEKIAGRKNCHNKSTDWSSQLVDYTGISQTRSQKQVRKSGRKNPGG